MDAVLTHDKQGFRQKITNGFINKTVYWEVSMMKKYQWAAMVTLAVLLGFFQSAAIAIEFTESYGNFINNNAAGYAFVWKTGQATLTGAPSPLPAPMYLRNWTYALSSTGHGCSDGMYLAVMTWDGNLANSTVVGISSSYVDMAAEYAAWRTEEGSNTGFGTTWYTGFRTVTWQFDYVPVQPNTLYAMTFMRKNADGNFYISLGGVELDTSNAFTGGFVTGGTTMNQPAWEAHYIATYSDVTPYPTYTAPADGAVNQATNVQLSWTAPNAFIPVGYNVYIDPFEPNLTPAEADYYVANQPGTTYTPTPALTNGTTYYWRVEALEPNLIAPYAPIPHSGPVWEFTTVPLAVISVADPVSQTVAAGDTVVLTFETLNATSWQWYKNGSILAGETSPTLTIPNFQLANEGFYTCTASNTLPSSVTSSAAQVMTKRLAGWWKLDDPDTTGGYLADSVQEEVPGAPAHIATAAEYRVAAGKDGSAIELNGTTTCLVTVSNSADFFNFYPQGYTVSAWINRSAASAWGAYVSKQSPATTEPAAPAKGFILTHDNVGQPVHTLRTVSPNDLSSNIRADDNLWHLVTGTYDAATKTSRIYVDGILRNQVTYSAHPAVSPAALIFGAEFPNGAVAYTGLLDDVRIWTYPLNAQEIAKLYTDFNPSVYICVEQPALDITGPNGVPDCKVDLYDFAQTAAAWLECGRYPELSCN